MLDSHDLTFDSNSYIILSAKHSKMICQQGNLIFPGLRTEEMSVLPSVSKEISFPNATTIFPYSSMRDHIREPEFKNPPAGRRLINCRFSVITYSVRNDEHSRAVCN
jgi:hypothetical protein